MFFISFSLNFSNQTKEKKNLNLYFFFLNFISSKYINNLCLCVIQRSVTIVSVFVGPCFVAECTYKIWWYASGASQIPFLGNVYVSDAVACILELWSWLYRTTVIFLVCVLFRLICHLQILRLHDFARFFHVDSDVASVMSEHLRIRRHLRIISHRFRAFILLALVLVTGSQFACLLVTTKHHDMSIYKTGELAVCPSLPFCTFHFTIFFWLKIFLTIFFWLNTELVYKIFYRTIYEKKRHAHKDNVIIFIASQNHKL